MERPVREERAAQGQRSDARRRRRGLYGPPPRLTTTSPLTGRLLWHIGDWGRASEHIGGRWEQVATDLLSAHLGADEALIVLAAQPGLLGQVQSSGLPQADAMHASRRDARLVLEPLDFKWSLETASVSQVSRETLERLLTAHLPLLDAALAAAFTQLGFPPDAEAELLDGRFLAPEHSANRDALRTDPGLPSTLYPIDPQAFFAPLPWWSAAQAVARMEGGDLERVRGIEAVERYYRLGAGVGGALTRLRTGLFEEDVQPLDVPAAVAELRRSGRAPTLNALLLDLERRLSARRAAEERLATIPRAAYPFGRLRADLERVGAPRKLVEGRAALGRLYSEVMRTTERAVRAEGRALVTRGLGVDEALNQLAAQPDRWAATAQRRALDLLASSGRQASADQAKEVDAAAPPASAGPAPPAEA